MSRRRALGAAALLVLGGCQASVTGESKEAAPSEVTSGPAVFTAEPGIKPEGKFYAVIGGDTSNDNRLYELGFMPPALRLLAEARRVSAVGACRDRVVVAAGQPEVGYSDHLQELRNDALGALDGLGLQPGFSPELDDRCRIAYTWVDRESATLDDELRVWDPAEKKGRTLYRGGPGESLVEPDWGPAGEAAVVRLDPKHSGEQPPGAAQGRPAAVIVVRSNGSTLELGAFNDPRVLVWGQKWLAVLDDSEGTVFVDPGTNSRQVLKGWYPLAWSPDGDQLLVNDASTSRILGVVNAADLSSVQEVGKVSGPVYDVDWLPA